MTWTKEEHEAVKREVDRGGHLDNDEAQRALAEIDRAWAEIERLHDAVCHAQSDEIDRLNARLLHAHDAANKLYQAALRVCDDYVRGEEGETPAIRDLRAALDPAEIEACAKGATRRDGLEAEIERLTKKLDEWQASSDRFRLEAQRLTRELAALRAPTPCLDSHCEHPAHVSLGQTLTRSEAHRKLLALGMTGAEAAHVLDYPGEVAATDAVKAIVAAYQRHASPKTPPVPYLEIHRREQECGRIPWICIHLHEQNSTSRVLCVDADGVELDPALVGAIHTGIRGLVVDRTVLVPDSPLESSAWICPQCADGRITEPKPEHICPRCHVPMTRQDSSAPDAWENFKAVQKRARTDVPILTPAEEAEIIAGAPGQIGPGQTPIGRPLPADASLEALFAKWAPLLSPYLNGEQLADLRGDVVRAVDASRPGLSEEEARGIEERIYNAILDLPSKSILGEDVRWGIREALRASRGETGPAASPDLDPAVLAAQTLADLRHTEEPAPDLIGPRGSSFDDAAFGAPAPLPACSRCSKADWTRIPDSLAMACKACGAVMVGTSSEGWEPGASLQEWAADLARTKANADPIPHWHRRMPDLTIACNNQRQNEGATDHPDRVTCPDCVVAQAQIAEEKRP